MRARKTAQRAKWTRERLVTTLAGHDISDTTKIKTVLDAIKNIDAILLAIGTPRSGELLTKCIEYLATPFTKICDEDDRYFCMRRVFRKLVFDQKLLADAVKYWEETKQVNTSQMSQVKRILILKRYFNREWQKSPVKNGQTFLTLA